MTVKEFREDKFIDDDVRQVVAQLSGMVACRMSLGPDGLPPKELAIRGIIRSSTEIALGIAEELGIVRR